VATLPPQSGRHFVTALGIKLLVTGEREVPLGVAGDGGAVAPLAVAPLAGDGGAVAPLAGDGGAVAQLAPRCDVCFFSTAR